MVITLTHVEPLNQRQSETIGVKNLPVAGVLHHVAHFFLAVFESFTQALIDQALVGVFFGEVIIGQVLLHLVLDMEWKSVLQETTHFPAILAVAIAHRKEVAMLQAHYVRRCDVGILICFVRVVRSNSSLGSE